MDFPQIIETEKIPIYVYAKISDIEPDCLQQTKNIANLQPAFHHIALMPDAHVGYGMPIGGILALKDNICPNAVGVDIGCGMGFVPTNLKASVFTKENLTDLVHQIMRDIPTGFSKHKEPKPMPDFLKDAQLPTELDQEISKALKSLGTLGGGNHFIDILKDADENAAIMLHSGSRHLGYSIANYFHKKAQQQCAENNITLPDENLAYLDANSEWGREYIESMSIALQFAYENRKQMMNIAQHWLNEFFGPVKFGEQINAHHNYAALEKHFGEKVWLHRKGAIKADKGDPIILPGCMTGKSYVGEGLGDPYSFNSSSHGAGRVMGRKEAKRRYTVEEVLKDIENHGIVLGKVKKGNIAEESRFVYKDIQQILDRQKSLSKMTIELTPLATIIG